MNVETTHLRVVTTPGPQTICDACSERPVCKTPCSRLEQLMPPATTPPRREICVPELAQGRRFASVAPANETYGRSRRLALLAPRVRGLVEELPPIQRLVVEAIFFEQQSTSAVAERLGSNVAFVKRILSVAFEALRKKIRAMDDAGLLDGSGS